MPEEAQSVCFLTSRGTSGTNVVQDLITYEIVELKPVLKVREATAGKGVSTPCVCGFRI